MPAWKTRGLGGQPSPRPRPLYRSADQRLPGDSKCGGPALHPASRRPPGFLHAPDDKTIAFADFVGSRQYITIGNLADNPKVHLFLIDYAQQRRIKIWDEARVVEEDGELVAQLMPRYYKAGRDK